MFCFNFPSSAGILYTLQGIGSTAASVAKFGSLCTKGSSTFCIEINWNSQPSILQASAEDIVNQKGNARMNVSHWNVLPTWAVV